MGCGGHTSELSVQPRGSLAASLAFLLGSLDPGPGGTAAHGALSLAPDFQLTASHGLQTHPSLFFCSSGSGLSLALPHLLHSSPGAGSLLPKPQLPTQLSWIRTSPSLLPSASPPHRTPVVGLRLALSHFPIDDSWIRRGEAPAARAGGEFVASPSLASQCPQVQLSSFLSPESLLVQCRPACHQRDFSLQQSSKHSKGEGLCSSLETQSRKGTLELKRQSNPFPAKEAKTPLNSESFESPLF